jgi:hypothetical protein
MRSTTSWVAMPLAEFVSSEPRPAELLEEGGEQPRHQTGHDTGHQQARLVVRCDDDGKKGLSSQSYLPSRARSVQGHRTNPERHVTSRPPGKISHGLRTHPQRHSIDPPRKVPISAASSITSWARSARSWHWEEPQDSRGMRLPEAPGRLRRPQSQPEPVGPAVLRTTSTAAGRLGHSAAITHASKIARSMFE